MFEPAAYSLPDHPRLRILRATGRLVQALREERLTLAEPGTPWSRPGLPRQDLDALVRLDRLRWPDARPHVGTVTLPAVAPEPLRQALRRLIAP